MNIENFINGEYKPSANIFFKLNPFTNEFLYSVANTTVIDLAQIFAVDADIDEHLTMIVFPAMIAVIARSIKSRFERFHDKIIAIRPVAE